MASIQKTKQIFEFIKRYQLSNPAAPTIAEIGRHFDMSSTASVHSHLKRMESLGWIKRERYSRFIQIVEQERRNAA